MAPENLSGCSHSTTTEGAAFQEAVIWLLCHYPDTAEAEERIATAARLHTLRHLPIWLFGSSSARYPESVERLMKRRLVALGVAPEAVVCSGDLPGVRPSLDTVQEACHVVAEAKRQGIRTLLCVSNRLQLLQVKALLRGEPLMFVWVPTKLRDWRWWYLATRLLLIPLAFIGAGRRFPPLVFVRWARSRIAGWPF